MDERRIGGRRARLVAAAAWAVLACSTAMQARAGEAVVTGEETTRVTVDARLEAGGLSSFARAPRDVTGAPPGWQARRLAGRLERARAKSLGLVPQVDRGGKGQHRPPTTHALGDRVVLSLDDGLSPALGDDYEARLDVSGGVAGPTDFVAVRYRSHALAQSPPYRVTELLVGIDDLHGRATWPVLGVTLEDPAQPLVPGLALGAGNSVNDVDTTGALPPPVAGARRPQAFTRVAAGLPDVDVPDVWLTDGSYDDDFERGDEPLESVGTDWLECLGTNCGGFDSLRVQGNRAVKTSAPGDSVLALEFQELGVFEQRPATELDLDVSVALDLSAPTASRAGLALRPFSADAFYRVEYLKATDEVEVAAVNQLGPPDVLATLASPVAGDTPTLGVRVTGLNPEVTFEVTVNGMAAGTVTDAVYRYAGVLVGLTASDGASSGEAWDDLVVMRRPDVFAIIGFPPGENVGLPLDVSDSSFRTELRLAGVAVSDTILLSTDGATYQNRVARFGCENPGNPFVQLEIEETTNSSLLFENEAHVVSVDFACAGCPTGPAPCFENLGLDERQRPVPTVGEDLDVIVSWWNAHLSDADSLIFVTELWDSPCSVVGFAGTNIVDTTSVIIGADTGQLTDGPMLRSANVGTFTLPGEGDYCVVVGEFHDLNGDCCPDGDETTPFPGGGCPGVCTPVPATDSNGVTFVTVRDLQIEESCMPGTIALAGDSLRVTRPEGDAVQTDLSWMDTGVFPGTYNVHAMLADRYSPDACFHEAAPVIGTPVGVTARSLDLTPPSGVAVWLAVFETDGCPGGASVPDDGYMDVGVLCTP